MSTMGAHINGRTGALAALAFAATIVLVLASVAVIALFDAAEGDTDAELHQLADYRAQIAMQPAAGARLKEAMAQAANAQGLITATSTALAQAALESDLRSVAKDNGAEVRSAEILAATRVKDFEAVAVQSDVAVPMSRLRDFVYAIEAHTPYYFIDHVSISAQEGWSGDDTSAPKDPQLDIRWTVTGYRWAGRK